MRKDGTRNGQRASWRRDQRAVSSVIGTVLMIAVTVTVFSGVAVVVLDQLGAAPDPGGSDVVIDVRTGTMVLTLQGGEPIDLAEATIRINTGPYAIDASMALFAAQVEDGSHWGLGEPLCLVGRDASCLYPYGTSLAGVRIVAGNVLLLDHGLPGDATESTTDLVATAVQTSPAVPKRDDVVTVTATVTNAGTTFLTDASVQVRLRVDGTTVDTQTLVPPMAGGTARDVELTWTATTGLHALTVDVDPTDLVAEDDEGNNSVATTVTVLPGDADPGQPFEDGDGDGYYYPADDVLIPTADVTDGVYDAGSNGLVIPASVGNIVATQIGFDSTADLTIAVDLRATGGPFALTGANLNLDGRTLQDTSNGAAMTLTASMAIHAAGATISSAGAMTFQSDGAIDLAGATVTGSSSGAAFVVDAGTDLEADGLVATVQGAIDWDAAGDVQAEDADLAIGLNGASLTVDAGGDAFLNRSSLDTDGPLRVTAGDDVHVASATLATDDNDFDLTVGSVFRTAYVDGATFQRQNGNGKTVTIAPVGASVDGSPQKGAWSY